MPVYLDGDSPDGQKLGARFKVRGYPTMILFRPDGTEVTRLPGEVDGERYLQVLTLAMNAVRPVRDTLQAVLGGTPLSADDWRLLADYSWDTDEQQLVGSKDLPVMLQRLAKAAPPGDAAVRLALKSIVVATDASPETAARIDKTAVVEQLMKTLASPQVVRDNMDLLANYAAPVIGFISTPKSAARTQLATAWNKALQNLAVDTTLSKADRLSALEARVALARMDQPKGALDAALLNDVRQQVAQADRATTDTYERQAVISGAGHVLSEAGLLDASDTLLKAELKRSHSPYYFMLALASNAKKRGDNATALDWYEQAYQAAKGPATRLQWGVTYLSGLIDLAPDDEKRIEIAAKTMFVELGGTQNAFYERNHAVLERLSRKLAQWNTAGKHDAALQRVSGQLADVCAKLPSGDSQRASCKAMVTAARTRP